MRRNYKVFARLWTQWYDSVGHLCLCTHLSFQQTEENNLQAAKRRAEREAGDYKQKALKSVSDTMNLIQNTDFPFLAWSESLRGSTIAWNDLPIS